MEAIKNHMIYKTMLPKEKKITYFNACEHHRVAAEEASSNLISYLTYTHSSLVIYQIPLHWVPTIHTPISSGQETSEIQTETKPLNQIYDTWKKLLSKPSNSGANSI